MKHNHLITFSFSFWVFKLGKEAEGQISISDVMAKVARQIRGDWLDARIYLEKFGFKNLDLTKEEKRFLKKHFGLQTR